MRNLFTSHKLALALIGLAAMLFAVPTNAYAGGAQIVIVNVNAPGVGFNDPTPAAPVGGNPGTTLGQQRLNVFNHVAQIWGATLDSNVQIRIVASMEPLATNVLGSTGVLDIEANFSGTGDHPGALVPNTWYPKALANKLAGVELNPASGDFRMRFSTNFDFYLGLDNNHGNQNDLVTVLLHEFAHGLGFSSFVARSGSVGQYAGPPSLPDIYSSHMFDNTVGLHWNEMTTDAQRAASMINWGNVIWDGNNVTNDLPSVLTNFGSPEARITAPSNIAGIYEFGTAGFGPQLSSPGVSAQVVQALDAANAAGPSTLDACTPLTNAAAVAGNIALIERGTCTFTVKVKNAQNAGALGVMIFNNTANAAAAAPGLGGADPTITIPSVGLSRTTGLKITAELANGVQGTLGANPAIRPGADADGRARLYEPSVIATGSSTSHFDTIAFPNLLMEPAINPDLTHNVEPPYDLTHSLLKDIGWYGDADLDGVADATDCETHSDLSATVVIQGCDTGVANTLFADGCTIADVINHFASSTTNHGDFVSAVTRYADGLKKGHLITGAQQAAIVSCAANSTLP